MQFSNASLSRIFAYYKNRLQNIIARGVVRRVNLSSNLQTLQVEVLQGETLELEYFEPGGITSAVPLGAEASVVFVGGSRSHGLAVAALDRKKRPTDMTDGETVIYNSSDVQLRLLPDNSLVINASAGVTINGDLTVSGNVSDSVGSMVDMRTVYNTHTHADPQGGNVTPPPQQMI